ncbi:MAG: RbsD/FucU domain-containing protein [Terracidiphilus sp.]
MRRALLTFSLMLAFASGLSAQASAPAAPTWREKIAEAMPLLGHRNWILIVDSAYPLQSATGIQTIETDAGQLEVLRHVLFAIDRSIHVRPVVTTDAELPFIAEEDAPGVSTYRTEINDLLRNYPVDSLPHDRIIANIEEASKHFNVLVLKTNMTVPYTSVFIRLDCKYWSADAEQRLRAKMAAKAQPAQ